MVEKLFYPCIIREEDGWHYVDFPDFEACFTDGETLEEALYYAKDVLTAVLVEMASRGEEFPKASKPTDSGGMVVFIDVVKSYVLSKANNQSVKKTLTVPKWLNDLAVEKGINFSRTLQEALETKVNA